LFDDQFNYVASNSGVEQVQPGSSKQALVAPLQTITKNGYLYVYTSNESPQDVYFDDITVTHYTGPLLQEQAYYPFGLLMAGISDKAVNKLASQYKFNGGVEFEDEYGINLYSTFYRQYDPQIGRYNGVDILNETANNFTSYHFSNDNPVSFNDPSGDLATLSDLINSRQNAWGNSDQSFEPMGPSYGPYADFYNALLNGAFSGGGDIVQLIENGKLTADGLAAFGLAVPQDLAQEIRNAIRKGGDEGRNEALQIILQYGPIAALFNNLKLSGHLSDIPMQFDNGENNSETRSFENNSLVVLFSFSRSQFDDAISEGSNWDVNDLLQSVYTEFLATSYGFGDEGRMAYNPDMDVSDGLRDAERHLQALFTVFHDGVAGISSNCDPINSYFIDTSIFNAYNKVAPQQSLHAIAEVMAQLRWALQLLNN
jgi:RHS repeat-associated protein